MNAKATSTTCEKCGVTQDPDHPICVHMMGKKGGRAAFTNDPQRFKAMSQRGGTATRERHGHAFYQAIGKKGGDTVKAERGMEFYEEIGRKGGETLKAARGVEFYGEIGKKGGQRVRELIEKGKSEEDKS